jgi:hypothetical protein
VVQEAVQENKIEALGRVDFVGRRVCYDKPTSRAATGGIDIARVDVNAQIVLPREVMRVRAWATADVEHPANLGEIVVRDNRSELVLGEWRLPEPVDDRML